MIKLMDYRVFYLVLGVFLMAVQPGMVMAAESSKPSNPKVQPRIQHKANPSTRSTRDGVAYPRNGERRTIVREPELYCAAINRSLAIEQAKSKVKGKVLGITLRRKGASTYYRVRILDANKRVKTVNIPACK